MSVRVISGNANWALRERGSEQVIEEASDIGDIICMVEAREADKLGGLNPRTWDTVHYMANDGTKGNFFAIKKTIGEVISSELAGYIDVRGLNARYLLKVKVRIHGYGFGRVTFLIFHAPPKRFWYAWPKAMRLVIRELRATRGPVIVTGDFNKLLRAIIPLFKRIGRGVKYRSYHLITAVLVGPIIAGKGRKHNIGSDHKAISFTIQAIRKRARRIRRRRLLRRRSN